MTAGHAGYFVREVASGREDYYAGRGESPGQWTGSGAVEAGISGRVLDGQLEAIFNQAHPVTGEQLGAGYKVAGTYVDRFGNTQIKHKRAGFDATFSVPKSVSEIYAHAGPDIQAVVSAAIDVAVNAGIGHLEEHAAFSRTGKGGINQVDTEGLIVARFDHRTSRAGDPQLHAHLLISNRVKCVDGQWRALDARELYGELKTAGMRAQAVLRAELTDRLGVNWQAVTRHGQAEIVGVPTGLMELHSKRTQAVEAAAAKLIDKAEQALGRELTPAERGEKFDQAAVQTRAVKAKDLHAVEGLTDRWITESREAGFDAGTWLPDTLGQHQSLALVRTDSQIVEQALTVLTESKSTWGHTDAVREISRLIPAVATNGQLANERIEQAAEALMSDERVVGLSTPVPVPVQGSGVGVRRDGFHTSERHHARRYTTTETLVREQRVLDHAEQPLTPGTAVVPAKHVESAIDARADTGRVLSPDQVTAIQRVCETRESIVCLVGPAGAGKSATIGVAADAYGMAGVPVRGLAVSAVAAGVLREEAGITNSDTLAKLLYENAKAGGPGEAWRTRRGEVMVVDEASMVSSKQFAQLVDLAETAGAKIVAVGDYRQLGAVDAGGLFRLLAADTGGVELERVWRFTQGWEADASLRLRNADPSVIDVYMEQGRVWGGSRQQVMDQAFEKWAMSSMVSGEQVILTATDSETVTALNLRARGLLQDLGDLSPVGQHTTGAGLEVAVGEQVLTLRNDRRILTSGGGMVRNGDRWTAVGWNPDGGLRVEGMRGQGIAVLPETYLDAGHLDYAYATTVHKAQGVTVDRAITIIDTATSADGLYVGGTRGKQSNEFLVVCEADVTEYGTTSEVPSPEQVMGRALGRDVKERTATELLRERMDAPELVEQLDLGFAGTAPVEEAPVKPGPVEPAAAVEPGAAAEPTVPVESEVVPEPVQQPPRGPQSVPSVSLEKTVAPVVDRGMSLTEQVTAAETEWQAAQVALSRAETGLRVLDGTRYQANQRVNQVIRDSGEARQELKKATAKLEELTNKNPVSQLRNREQINALTNTKATAKHTIKISKPRLAEAVEVLAGVTNESNAQRQAVIDAQARRDQAVSGLKEARAERLAYLMDSPNRPQPIGPHPVLRPEAVGELFKRHEMFTGRRTEAIDDRGQAQVAHAGITRKIQEWQTQVDTLGVSIEEMNIESIGLSAGPVSRVRNRSRLTEIEERVGPKVMKKRGLEGDIMGAQPELKAATELLNFYAGSVERSTEKLTGIDSQLDADAVNRGLNIGATNWAPTRAVDNMLEPTIKNLDAWTRTAGIVEQTGITQAVSGLGGGALGHGVERQTLAINRFERQHSPVIEQGHGIDFGGISR